MKYEKCKMDLATHVYFAGRYHVINKTESTKPKKVYSCKVDYDNLYFIAPGKFSWGYYSSWHYNDVKRSANDPVFVRKVK